MRIFPTTTLIIFITTMAAHAAELTANTITVTGRAAVLVTPDYATIDMGVITSSKTVAIAAQENNVQMARVVGALARLGIPKGNVQTSKYNVSAINPRDETGAKDYIKTTGYQVTNKVTVTVSNVENLAKVIDAATQAGANSIEAINFEVKDKQSAEDQARTEAVRNARHQAEVLASAENAKIKKMIAMAVGTFSYGNEYVVVSATRLSKTPVLPGQVEVSVSVAVQYSLE